jgi:rare lipoprotein A
LLTLHLHVAIPYIVALAGVVALTNESSAAARHHGHHLGGQWDRHWDRHTAAAERPRWHHARADRAGASALAAHAASHRWGHGGSREAAEGTEHHQDAHHGRRDTAGDGGHSFSGFASYYSEGQRVASGGSFNPSGYTCAHRSLPFGTHLRVADPRSGRSVVVTVNDRGPFVHGRVLDLSLGAARALGMTGRGVMRVSASVI